MSEAKTEEIGLVYATHLDPMRDLPRTSLYLDEEQRRASEITRARLEGREPDLENPPAMQGTPLFSQAQLRGAIPRGVTLEPDVVATVNVPADESVTREDDNTDIRYDSEQGAKDHPEETQGANKEPNTNNPGAYVETDEDRAQASEQAAADEGANPTDLPGDPVNTFDLTGTNDTSTTR